MCVVDDPLICANKKCLKLCCVKTEIYAQLFLHSSVIIFTVCNGVQLYIFSMKFTNTITAENASLAICINHVLRGSVSTVLTATG